MGASPETCSECGKQIKGRSIPRVWGGERIVCPGCYPALASAHQPAPTASSITPNGGRLIAASPDDVLAEVVRLADSRRVARVIYQKPGEWSDTERLVEPYRLQESTSSLMVQCWQLQPEIEDRCKWRNFRLDRISSVSDGGNSFKPRIPITLNAGEVHAFEWGHEPIASLGPGAEYFSFLETVMLDGMVTADELTTAKELGSRVNTGERRGVHARVFANVLSEVLQDSEVSDRESTYLARVRAFLSQLGWAP